MCVYLSTLFLFISFVCVYRRFIHYRNSLCTLPSTVSSTRNTLYNLKHDRIWQPKHRYIAGSSKIWAFGPSSSCLFLYDFFPCGTFQAQTSVPEPSAVWVVSTWGSLRNCGAWSVDRNKNDMSRLFQSQLCTFSESTPNELKCEHPFLFLLSGLVTSNSGQLDCQDKIWGRSITLALITM